MAFREIFLQDTAGSPQWARQPHLARLGNQSKHRIWFILSTHGASHIITHNITGICLFSNCCGHLLNRHYITQTCARSSLALPLDWTSCSALCASLIMPCLKAHRPSCTMVLLQRIWMVQKQHRSSENKDNRQIVDFVLMNYMYQILSNGIKKCINKLTN